MSEPTRVFEVHARRGLAGVLLPAAWAWLVCIVLPALEGCAALDSGARTIRGQDPELPATGPASSEVTTDADVSAALRNRMIDTASPGEEPKFEYPDVHIDPLDYYRERYGVSRPDADRFVLPGLVNLIFEDRWLLDDEDPHKALDNEIRHRLKINIRDPDPDTANFPNSPYTIPKGRVYIENSPLGLYSKTRNGLQPGLYQWEALLRYGLTDNLEFRIFSNGLTYQSALGAQAAAFGYSPLAFDFKANFWEENTRYHIPAMGLEVYLQTELGSTPFNSGTQPSINVLFEKSLPFKLGLEYNVGVTGIQNGANQIAYQLSFQWALEREVVEDFKVFFHGFYNASALPRLLQFQSAGNSGNSVPQVTVMGAGGLWTVNNRLAIFGSYNFGITDAAPQTISLMGFAVAL